MSTKYRVIETSLYRTKYNKLVNDLPAELISKIALAKKILETEGTLPGNFRLHKLKGEYRDFWEFHIAKDLIITFARDKRHKEIKLIKIGTHDKVLR